MFYRITARIKRGAAMIGVFILAMALTTFTSSEISASGIFTPEMFYENFEDFNWNESHPGTFASDGEFLVAEPVVAGNYYAYKSLAASIPVDCDFILEAHLFLDGDPSPASGGMAIQLITDLDQIVAEINWYDNQSAAGYGGLDFLAENGNWIYHSGNSSYPNFNGIVKIVREGEIWSAWVNDDKIAEIILPPTLEPTKVRARYVYSPAPFHNYKIDYVLVTSEGCHLYPVSFDIKPGSCPNPLNVKSMDEDWLWIGGEEIEEDLNITSTSLAKVRPMRKKKAVLPAAILGTNDFDVNQIDVQTITLNHVPVLRWAYEDVGTPENGQANECQCNDYGPDGYTDLTLKFLRDEIIASLGEVFDGQVLPLTVRGQLIDGTQFEGLDCVVILASNENPVAAVGNYPNPFNPTTTIGFALDCAANIRLDVFNVMGQKVATLIDEYMETGRYKVDWDGTDDFGVPVASGIYLYRIRAGEFHDTQKMMLIK